MAPAIVPTAPDGKAELVTAQPRPRRSVRRPQYKIRMERDELAERVRTLRERSYTPREIARALGVSTAEASRLVRAEAIRRRSSVGGGGNDGGDADGAPRCFVSPGWHHGLGIGGQEEWLAAAAEVEAPPGTAGVVAVLVAAPQGQNRLSICGYLVDTWCLGVKNALGPKRVSTRDFEAFRQHYFEPWRSRGVPIPVELARHLVLGAVEYARGLGFEPHRDLRRARDGLGAWEGPSVITFGRDGTPYYTSGPYDDPERVLATLDRRVGRGGYHYTVEVGGLDDLGDGYRYTCTITDQDEIGEAA